MLLLLFQYELQASKQLAGNHQGSIEAQSLSRVRCTSSFLSSESLKYLILYSHAGHWQMPFLGQEEAICALLGMQCLFTGPLGNAHGSHSRKCVQRRPSFFRTDIVLAQFAGMAQMRISQGFIKLAQCVLPHTLASLSECQ